jgi:hypothetical protein
MKFLLIRIIMAGVWITCAYKWGDWRNWRRYYPTMLFFGFGDLIYHLVFKDKHLWVFQSNILALSINELFIIFAIFFPTTLLFLSNFPQTRGKQVKYLAFWISLYIAIELFTTSIGMQKNYNGWNIWWSLLHNAVQFPLLILHHKNPILAWTIALMFLAIVMRYFDVPAIIGRRTDVNIYSFRLKLYLCLKNC